jgi:ribosomal protein L12E/L44/L45/RPP1/RPP2
VVTLFIGAFFDNEVSVQLNAPQTVTAGDEFKVKVKVSKGKIESFSRLLQELPAGLKATSVNSANADFTFKDNKVRLIWLKMPENDSISIEYTIKTDQRLKGNFDLGGKFSYIDNNERMTAEATPLTITINPNPNIDPKLIVDIKDFKEQVIPEISSEGQGMVACVRQKPQPTGDADNSYLVNLLVYKDNAQKFAKIEEAVPAGFTALKVESKDGIFVFKDGLAKFLWMSLPTSPYFMVSYRLVPNTGNKNAPVLKGQFSYVTDEKTITKDIVEKDLTLASLSDQDIQNLVKEINTKPSVSNALIAEALQTTQPIKTDCTKIAANESNKEIAKNTEKKSWFQKNNLTGSIDKAYTLEPEEGVYFRVQVAAGHRTINIKRYFRKFKIADEVRAEDHEGWHKYSIGSFADYKQARDYRVHIWNTTPITGAFVSAYNSGKRITVQEALMITNQQWYK